MQTVVGLAARSARALRPATWAAASASAKWVVERETCVEMNERCHHTGKAASRAQTVGSGSGRLLSVLSNSGATWGKMQRAHTHHRSRSHVFTPDTATQIKTESGSCSPEISDFPSWSRSSPSPRREPGSDLSLRPLPSLELRVRGITTRSGTSPTSFIHSFIPEALLRRSQRVLPPDAPISASIVLRKPHGPLRLKYH